MLEFILPEHWKGKLEMLAALKGTPSVLVSGPKNVGKTTFAKLVLNLLLEKHKHVAFLESDVGQGEFTPGGLMSITTLSAPLFGPAFMHLQSPERAYFVGAVSPRAGVHSYISHFGELMTYYNQNLAPRKVPLVINTHGWVKGLGCEILRSLVMLAKPDQVIELEASQASKNLPANWIFKRRESLSFFEGTFQWGQYGTNFKEGEGEEGEEGEGGGALEEEDEEEAEEAGKRPQTERITPNTFFSKLRGAYPQKFQYAA